MLVFSQIPRGNTSLDKVCSYACSFELTACCRCRSVIIVISTTFRLSHHPAFHIQPVSSPLPTFCTVSTQIWHIRFLETWTTSPRTGNDESACTHMQAPLAFRLLRHSDLCGRYDISYRHRPHARLHPHPVLHGPFRARLLNDPSRCRDSKG
jgi:hypothetical protein